MSKKEQSPKPMAGITAFEVDDDDYIAPPPTAVRERAKADNQAHGFVSERTVPRRGPAPKAPDELAHNYTVRIRDVDRTRFEDFAYKHRISKGEAMKQLLDIAEKDESGE
jgi:hypothetical protein